MTAGLIGLGLLAVFMIFMYGVKGILASIALGLYSIILLFVLKASIPSVWPMLISFVIYTYVSYQILYSKEDGFEKFVSFVVATFETIGASVSESLKSKAVFSLIIALVAIILYIAISFRNIPRKMQPIIFGYAAIIALFHDVIIILDLFSFFQLEINALFITALLTIIGLQTLSRSLNTSISTVLTLGALYFFGAESLKNLSLALLLGIIVGTYSSIFIATTSLLKISKQK